VGSKRIFSTLFIILIILLMVMPFVTTFNEFLTSWVLKFGWYKSIENLVLPFEIKAVVGFLWLLHIEAIGSPTTLSIVREGSWQKIWVSWNCVGWQSLIVFLLTLATGFSGNYTKLSKVETILIGILGIFLVNLARINAVVLIFKFAGYLPAVIFHDYFANMAIVVWFFFFWWFSYSFILETKNADER